MNKQFSVFIAVAATILVLLLLVLAAFRTQGQKDALTNNTAQPTSTTINRGSTYSGTLPTITNNPVLPQSQTDALSSVVAHLPYDTDALAVDYSPLTNKIYIEKKTGKADVELQKFLESNNLQDQYIKNPNLFKVISTNIGERLNKETEQVTEPSSGNGNESAPIPTLGYSQQTKENQTSSFNSLIRNLLSFKIPETKVKNALVLTLPGISNPSPTTINTPSTSGGSQVIIPFTNTFAQIGGYKLRGQQYDWGPYSCLNPPGQQAGAKALQIYVNSVWGGGTSYIGNCTPKAGKYSIHAEGRAVDSMFSVSNPDLLRKGNEVFGWLLTNASAIGIQYIKFWRVQWTPGEGLSCVTDAGDQRVHATHIHFELNWLGARQQTPYFTSGSNSTSTITINQDICPIVK